jgi:hypothetical protein
MKRHASRYERGKANAAKSAITDESSIVRATYRNPLKGDEKKPAMAQVKPDRGGVFVLFRMRF